VKICRLQYAHLIILIDFRMAAPGDAFRRLRFLIKSAFLMDAADLRKKDPGGTRAEVRRAE